MNIICMFVLSLQSSVSYDDESMDSIPSSVSATPSGSSGAAIRKRKSQAAKVDPIEEVHAAAKYKEKEVARVRH